jgi:hypothetical protein
MLRWQSLPNAKVSHSITTDSISLGGVHHAGKRVFQSLFGTAMDAG